MSFHRYIPASLDIRILDPVHPPPGRLGGEEADDQEVIEDLIKAINGLRPKNKQGKAYQVAEVKQRSR